MDGKGRLVRKKHESREAAWVRKQKLTLKIGIEGKEKHVNSATNGGS